MTPTDHLVLPRRPSRMCYRSRLISFPWISEVAGTSARSRDFTIPVDSKSPPNSVW